MTTSRFFLVLLRLLGFYLVAVHGSRACLYLPAMLSADDGSDQDFGLVATTVDDAFFRRAFIQSAAVAAFGLYALFDGRAMLRLLPADLRAANNHPVLLNAEAITVGVMRIVGLVLVAMYLQVVVQGVSIIIRMWFDRDAMTRGAPFDTADTILMLISMTVPFAIGLYLLFGGGFIRRQVASVALPPRTEPR